MSAGTVARRFGENLRRHRKQAGISQEALGCAAGLHRTEVGLLERGERTPRIDTVIKLCSSLEIGAGELLAGIEWDPAVIVIESGSFKAGEGD